jgi:hypothetical protein
MAISSGAQYQQFIDKALEFQIISNTYTIMQSGKL